MILFPPVIALFYVYKRRVFTVLKSRKVYYKPKDGSGNGGH
jgi:hypothetical protein